jgi:hypothetical protein
VKRAGACAGAGLFFPQISTANLMSDYLLAAAGFTDTLKRSVTQNGIPEAIQFMPPGAHTISPMIDGKHQTIMGRNIHRFRS